MNTQQEAKRTWWVVELDVETQQEELVSWLMINIGSNGCQIVAGANDRVTLQASFDSHLLSADGLQPVKDALSEYGLAQLTDSLRLRQIEEEDWLLEWKKGLRPLKLGELFLVCPPWLENQISDADRSLRHVIWIEPGMAFGTGFHFTTQFCLCALEKHIQPGNVLDVGSGSGILSIAAAKLAPDRQITALEIDTLACRVARENFALNHVSGQITLIEGSVEKVQGQKFNIILSTLTCEDNLALLP